MAIGKATQIRTGIKIGATNTDTTDGTFASISKRPCLAIVGFKADLLSPHRSNRSRISRAKPIQIKTDAKIPAASDNTMEVARLTARSIGSRMATKMATQIRTGNRMPAVSANTIKLTRLVGIIFTPKRFTTSVIKSHRMLPAPDHSFYC
jgi:hypothetical protein